MRIAIIGAPGSGKTDLGRSITRSLNRDHQGGWKLIDNYVDKLSQRTGVTYNAQSGYIENVTIMTTRWLLEDEAAYQQFNTISCGSIYETFVYAAMLNTTPAADEQARLFQHHLVSTMMNFFSIVEPSGRYDQVFFLPLSQERLQEHSWDVVLDSKIPDILQSCGVTATVLTGNHRSKVKDALKITRFIRDQIFSDSETQLDEQS